MPVATKRANIFHWGRLLTVTGGAQALVQALSLISGILVIRLLPTQEYAWYTITNTILGSMIILSDGGIAVGVMSEGAKVWQNKREMGIILATGLNLRRKFAIGSLLVSLPILSYLLFHHNASWLTILLISVSLIPVFYATLSDSLLEIILKLHQDVTPLQKNQIFVAVARLLVTGLTLFAFPFASISILANGIPRIFGNIQLYKMTSAYAERKLEPDSGIKRNILKVVNRRMPESIYFCVSGQITIWLISIFGNTTSVAEVGALGRLAMVLNVFSSIIAIIIIPRYAKLFFDRTLLLRRLFQVISALIAVCLLIISISWAFPHQILWILGESYKNLDIHLLFLSIYIACLNLIAGTIFGLYTSRGWSIHPFLSIIVSLLSSVIGILIFDMSSITGVLYLNIFVSLVHLVLHACFSIIKITGA